MAAAAKSCCTPTACRQQPRVISGSSKRASGSFPPEAAPPRCWRGPSRPFAERSQLASVLAVLLPMAVYVGGIALLGLYLPSALLIGWFMRRHGGFGWLASAIVSVAVPVAFFLVFERWFLVPLPKGPLENYLGY